MDQEIVNKARKEAEEAYLIYANLKETYHKAEQDWLKKSRRFKDFDYQLAQTDGRLKKISSNEKERKEKKLPELTLEQLQSIAEKLGVNITIDETEETNQEVNDLMEEE
jgi:phage terminase Nu1 subunit (DNA packaging protein)